MENYKQLIYEQRCQIQALKKTGITQKSIGEIIGVSQSTVSRELRRNTGFKGYRHKQAQRFSDNHRQATHRPIKMIPGIIQCIGASCMRNGVPNIYQVGFLMKKTYR